MSPLLETKIGRLRILGFLEGLSLLALVFVAMPMKYLYNDPSLVKTLGPIHGALFVLFMLAALAVGVREHWKLKTGFIIFLSSFIPFGNFYIDHKIFKPVQEKRDGNL